MNAGIVLLNNYIIQLFERLGLLDKKKFRSVARQLEAVHYLQFLATGSKQTEESFLPLNKILCGLDPATPVPAEISLTQEEEELFEGMINAVAKHWPEIGNTSIDGFRGNWLVRDGVLYAEEEKWQLVVEKRPYDILISKAPFSFSIIRLPWMEKPLHVTWPY